MMRDHESAVDFEPSSDPLHRNPPLRHALDLPVLGLPTRFTSNSRHVIDLVGESMGGWRVVGHLASRLEPLSVRVVVIDGREGGATAPVRHFAPDATRVVAHSPGSWALSDPERRESIIYATPEIVVDRAHFRLTMLEAMTLALLTHFDRHPLHTAAIGRNGRTALLAGPSGSGKSTLARLAHGAGMDVLSEDTVWVQQAPVVRLWGWPGYVRLLEPGTAAKTVVPLPDTARVGCYVAENPVVCILERGAQAAAERVDESFIMSALASAVAPGFDRFPERHEAVARTLARSGGWKLTLSDNPTDALPLLDRVLEAPRAESL